jgi:hypothetical protein
VPAKRTHAGELSLTFPRTATRLVVVGQAERISATRSWTATALPALAIVLLGPGGCTNGIGLLGDGDRELIPPADADGEVAAEADSDAAVDVDAEVMGTCTQLVCESGSRNLKRVPAAPCGQVGRKCIVAWLPTEEIGRSRAGFEGDVALRRGWRRAGPGVRVSAEVDGACRKSVGFSGW